MNSAVGRAEGLREEQLHELARYRGSTAFSEVERVVLDLAVAMTRTPADVPEALFSDLKEHLTPSQIVELVTAIAQENFRARFNRPFDVGSEDFSDGAFCPLPER